MLLRLKIFSFVKKAPMPNLSAIFAIFCEHENIRNINIFVWYLATYFANLHNSFSTLVAVELSLEYFIYKKFTALASNGALFSTNYSLINLTNIFPAQNISYILTISHKAIFLILTRCGLVVSYQLKHTDMRSFCQIFNNIFFQIYFPFSALSI